MKGGRFFSKSQTACSGFTLLEVVIAVGLFSIIISVVLMAYSRTMANVAAIQDTAFTYEAAKNAMDRMVTDLESILISMPPAYKKPQSDEDPDPFRITLESDNDSGLSAQTLRFVSLAHVDFEGSGQEGAAQIIYYVTPEKGEEEGYVLRRRDVLSWDVFEQPDELGNDPVLCDRIQSVEFICYDVEGEEHETWDSDSEETKFTTPRAIGVKLDMGGDPDAEIAPYHFETIVSLPMYREE